MRIKSKHAAPALIILISALMSASTLLLNSVESLNENMYLSIIIIQLIVMALPTVFYCRLRHSELDGRLRVRVFGVGHIMLIVFASILIIAGNAFFSVSMFRLFPDAYKESLATDTSSLLAAGGINYLYAAIAFAVLPAITEEFLFRSVIIAEYEKYGVFTAVVLSSLMFSMIHFSFVKLPSYFFTGVILASVIYASRSVFASITVHIICNVTTLFFDEYLNRLFLNNATGLVLLHIILAALTLIFAILFFGEEKSLYKAYAAANIPSDYRTKPKKGPLPPIAEAILNPTFIILTVFYIIVTSVK